jgi:hypothetical protein
MLMHAPPTHTKNKNSIFGGKDENEYSLIVESVERVAYQSESAGTGARTWR